MFTYLSPGSGVTGEGLRCEINPFSMEQQLSSGTASREERSFQSDTTTISGDNWSNVQDASQRKRIQNRLAQRTYRKLGRVRS